jgi:hypothetical protein
MSIETLEIEAAATEQAPFDSWMLQWTPIVAGAFVACAVSLIMVTFATTIGLGVSSTAPTWRDTSVALWLLSGIYLIIQALISFGCGGYLAGRCRVPYGAADSNEIERRDGLHGIASWSLAVVLGAVLTALIAFGASKPTSLSQPASTTEPSVLSYELDQLFRSAHRPNLDLTPLRTEAGRILMKSSSHSGVSAGDRAYLVQLVNATTGISGPDAEHRVDTVIAESHTAIARARAGAVILSFCVAAALLLGAAAAWAGAEAGGGHRDGRPLSEWMRHANYWNRRRTAATFPG